jgi:ADP-ribosylglycohydrolase
MSGAGDDLATYLRSHCMKYPRAGYGKYYAEWIVNDSLGPYDSWGNGSAMRVSSVGYWAETKEEVMDLAKRSAIVTHGHPTAIKGAQATAYAIWFLRNGGHKDDLKDEIEKNFEYDLSKTIDEIRPTYKWTVKCSETVPPAIRAVIDSDNFKDVMFNCISIGGDSDTLGAIAGSIAEVIYGIPDDVAEFCIPRLNKDLFEVLHRFYAEVEKRGK